ncbi:hypothetical protein GUITHDRAFT_142722 [Guillardia theta CCMP2712]|uniref:Phospholipid/glycerol acyltransferase domain-containing protein n=1 Tax=Guillardia theta (strain CCMP2712) TaxID=905079 RepID=L1IWZ7_GUITC|nr:hypothetical protein GUITHDRAFT_142722 [Guillardia theta CCMP2712]EKX40399.1 hypothetical protein GUITHDRAFT_142722 [Guillardia theta CCMP2712]|eukprot:XP_005827379.1 hypothetical protein GUITHDRAFT_142722 [Guillardia theta CCMP2712]
MSEKEEEVGREEIPQTVDAPDEHTGGSRNPSPVADLEPQSPDVTNGGGEADETSFLGSMFSSRRIASLKTLCELGGAGENAGEGDAVPSGLMTSCSFASFFSAASNMDEGKDCEQERVQGSREEDSGPIDVGGKSLQEQGNVVLPSLVNPTAMVGNLGWFWRTLGTSLFGGAVMERKQVEEIQSAASCGTIVYVVEAHSWLHLLFWNFILIRHRLPLASLAVGLVVLPYVSLMWPVWLLFHLLQLLGMSQQQRKESRKSKAVQAARNGQPLIFSAGGGRGGEEACELLEDIIVLQRNSSMPLIICPLIAIWNRTPLPSSGPHRSKGSRGLESQEEATGFLQCIVSGVFGSKRQPSPLRAFVSLLLDLRDHMQVGGGLPINLSEWLLDYRAASSPKHDKFREEEGDRRSEGEREDKYEEVTGPARQLRREARKEILSSVRVKAAIAAAAAQQAQVRTMSCCLRGFFNLMFHAVYLDEEGLSAVQRVSMEKNCPVIYVPTYRGVLDYLLLTYILFTRDMATPVIACSESSHMILKFLLRRVGGFFMRKSLASEDNLYKEIFREYISFLLETRSNLEVFIQGSRPYSMGLVGVAVEAVMSGRVKDVVVVPISIQYDRVVEGNNYGKQISGDQKVSPALPAFLASHWNIHMGFGNIIINFAEPLSVRAGLQQGMQPERKAEGQEEEKDEARRSGFNVVRTVATLVHEVTWMVNQRTVIIPTSLVATVLLTNSCRGISLSDLVENVQWLKIEIMARGGLVAPMQEMARAVGNSVKRISNFVKIPTPEKAGRKVHWIRTATLLRDAEILAEILKLEFTYSPRESKIDCNSGTVLPLYDDGYGERVQILTTRQARRMIGLLRGMLLPFLDAYWVAALSLLPLQTEAKGGVLLSSHLKRMQKIAQTMYLENKVHSSEASSSVSLINAVTMLEANRLIARSAIEQGVLIRVNDTRDRPTGEALFRSLVDAIKQIDARRRIAATLRMGPLQHEPSIT